ncbi:hypothetical protein ACHAXR_008680 [Thalassiosira sp. AJA248-18]
MCHHWSTRLQQQQQQQLQRPQPCAIIGAHVSKATEKLASLSAVFDLPVVSSSAMSPDLNDHDQYPTFLRTHTDVNGFGTMAVNYLVNNLGIDKFGLLYTNDGYGYGFSRSVLEAAGTVGAVAVGGGVPYNPPKTRTTASSVANDDKNENEDDDDDEADLRNALQTLANTGCNYFIADFYAESFARVMELAAIYGIAGPGKFWLVSGTSDMAPFILGGALKLPKDSLAVKAIEGNGIYFCEGGVPGLGGSYDVFTQKWRGLGLLDDGGGGGSGSGSEQALRYINNKQPLKPDGISSYTFPPEFFTKKRPHHVVTFSYDAAVGLALSACEAWENNHNGRNGTSSSLGQTNKRAAFLRRRRRGLEDDENVHESDEAFTGRSHYEIFANRSFQGASGNVQFRPSFPTRTAESSYFVMANLRAVEDESRPTTHVKFMGSPVISYFDTDKSTWKVLGDKKFVYPDGSATPPIGMVPLEVEKGWSSGQTVGITLVAVLLPIALVALFLYKRDKKRRMNMGLWAVKVSELQFDDPPIVIGRGTFGLVLLANYRGTQVAVKRVIPPRSAKPKTDMGRQSGGTNSSNRPLDNKFDLSNQYRSNGQGLGSGGLGSGEALVKERIRRGSVHMSDSDEEDFWDDNNPYHSNGSIPQADTPPVIEMPLSLGVMSGVQQASGGMLKKGTASKKQHGQKSSSIFALKTSKPDDHERLKSDFIVEMQQLSRLRHPCICTVMGAVIEAASEPMLVMEYMQMGSLFSLLHNETVALSGEILLPILQDVSKGLRFLHTAGPPVLHGDLKSANILVDSRFHGKVADFGLSQKKTIGAAGTPYWMASELLRGESENTPASDVYSFGIVLYEAYSRKVPYEGENYDEVIKLVMDPRVQKRPPVPPDCPSQIQSMMLECLVNDANKRPTFEELDIRLRRLTADSVNPAESFRSMQSKKNQNSRTDEIFYDNFPPKFAEALREGRKVEPEARECVTIFFSDIVGYTDMTSKMSPIKVSNMLDRLYLKFDELSRKHDIFKVETIGDAYMAVTNLIKDQSDHTKRVAAFSVEALKAANETVFDEDDPSLGSVRIRVGIHSGPVVANVVGSRNLKFSIFGDTVNVASRMESNSLPNRIHSSERAARLLQKQDPNMPIRKRGTIEIKGKGPMRTVWINEKCPTERGEELQ